MSFRASPPIRRPTRTGRFAVERLSAAGPTVAQLRIEHLEDRRLLSVSEISDELFGTSSATAASQAVSASPSATGEIHGTKWND